MDYVKLAKTDLYVSRLGFGAEPLGGTDWGQVDEKLAMSAVSRAVDLGINFFDTADVYGLGRSEELLSKALGHRRHDVIIASKFGVNWKEVPNGGRAKTFFDSKPNRVVEALENSLRRLRVDVIPLYFIHWPDPKTPLAKTLSALVKCQEAGKIKHIGVSNFTVDQIRQANEIANIAAVQLQYNLIERGAEQRLLPCCKELGLSVLAYGPLAQGLLTGKYDTNTRFAPDDRRHRLPHFQGEQLKKNLSIVSRQGKVGELYHKSTTQVAIRWILENPAISCAIVGAKSPLQIEHNVGAMGWKLPQSHYQFIVNGISATRLSKVSPCHNKKTKSF